MLQKLKFQLDEPLGSDIHITVLSVPINPLTPKNDKHLISPYNITPESCSKVMRILSATREAKEAVDCNTNSPCQHLRECMGPVWRIPLLILVCKGLILRWRVTLLEFSVLLKNTTKWPGQDSHTEDEDSKTDGQDTHYDSIIPNQYTKHKAKFNFSPWLSIAVLQCFIITSNWKCTIAPFNT